ncbi:MAG: universal stress protein [Chloroflexota bacterium]|nr:universal stress protein [Chloroflexota bacterium]
MINKILVPLDGSPLSACAFPHVIAFAQATGAQVTLLRVLEQSKAQAIRVSPLEWQLAKAEAQTYLDEIEAQLGQWLETKPVTQLLEGPAAERIIEQAQRQDVDLIVLSSHGESGLSGWNTSSVAQKVVQRAGKSILLVRAYHIIADCENGRWGNLRYRRILAPLDGSMRAESVLPLATALAQQHAAALLLVYAATRPELIQRVPLTQEDTALVEALVERNVVHATKYFEQLRARLSPEPETQILVNGHVTAALHKVVNQAEVDLVILSAHGASGHSQWPYGSVVNSFVTYGATPLLILQDLPMTAIESTQAERAVVAPQGWRKSSGAQTIDPVGGYTYSPIYAYKPAF